MRDKRLDITKSVDQCFHTVQSASGSGLFDVANAQLNLARLKDLQDRVSELEKWVDLRRNYVYNQPEPVCKPMFDGGIPFLNPFPGGEKRNYSSADWVEWGSSEPKHWAEQALDEITETLGLGDVVGDHLLFVRSVTKRHRPKVSE